MTFRWKRAIHTKPESKHGSLRAMTCRQDNDTPALNALKALRGAPISMGRGETPVELRQQPSFELLYFDKLNLHIFYIHDFHQNMFLVDILYTYY